MKLTLFSLNVNHENEINENDLINNLLEFSKLFLNVNVFLSYDIKKVKIKRYNSERISEMTNKIIDFVENKNPQLIVLNRSFNYENLSDGIPSLIKIIEKKI